MSGPEFTPGGTWHMKADPPRTAAGRALLADNGPRVETGDHDMARRILAIEAEARAAALEAAGTLDVERLRTADANVAESNPSGPYRWQVAYWHAVAAEYARLAEVDR